MRKAILTLAALLAAFLLFSLPPWPKALSHQPQAVIVTNLPQVLPIKGKVSIVGTVRQGAIVRRINLIVPPVERDDVSDLVQAEDVVTDGFTGMILSLHGAVRGTIGQEGTVGAILVPDETSVLEMLREKSVFHFPVEAKVDLTRQVAEDDFSVQRRFDVGFPRYKVYVYNSTDRTVDVHLFVYLTQ